MKNRATRFCSLYIETIPKINLQNANVFDASVYRKEQNLNRCKVMFCQVGLCWPSNEKKEKRARAVVQRVKWFS